MKIVHWNDISLKIRQQLESPVLALGNFDGVHLGHQEIVRRTTRLACQNKTASCLLLFNPHPLKLLKPGAKLNLITDFVEKAYLLSKLGVNYLIVKDFNRELAQTSPHDFVYQYLVNGLKVRGVVVGFDYSFGRGGKGSVAALSKLGEENGFFVDAVAPVLLSGKVVSSSLIRELILKGRVEEAGYFLGRCLRRKGLVVEGHGRGKILGYPTANLSCNSELVYPGRGVYLTITQIEEKDYLSLTNIGKKPTFGEEHELALETHILNFNGEIYAKEIFVYFLERIRPEKKFANESSLKEQIQKDIQLAYKIVSKKYARKFKLEKVSL